MRASRVVFEYLWQGNVVGFGLLFDWLRRTPFAFRALGYWRLLLLLLLIGCVPHGAVKLVGINRMVSLTLCLILRMTIKLTTVFYYEEINKCVSCLFTNLFNFERAEMFHKKGSAQNAPAQKLRLLLKKGSAQNFSPACELRLLLKKGSAKNVVKLLTVLVSFAFVDVCIRVRLWYTQDTIDGIRWSLQGRNIRPMYTHVQLLLLLLLLLSTLLT